jgi:uncharacterized membrane protein
VSDAILEAVKALPGELVVVIMSMLPVSELRGGIPAGVLLHVPLWRTIPLAIIANVLAVVPFLLWFDAIVRALSRWRIAKRFFDWVLARARRKSGIVDKYGPIGLTLFVAIPFPATGAWTGAIIAVLRGLPFWRSLTCIALGVAIAATVVTLACLGLVQVPFIEKVVTQTTMRALART